MRLKQDWRLLERDLGVVRRLDYGAVAKPKPRAAAPPFWRAVAAMVAASALALAVVSTPAWSAKP